MTKLRPLGNRRSMNIGGLILNIRESTGSVKMASEFFLVDSNTQLNLLDDWINALEEMYNAEVKQDGALRKRLKNPRQIRHYEG
jgi:hypothetical protein